jgi:broad specificity phosphatase PhoE
MFESRKIYLFRHGETNWNKERRWQGQTDVPLNVRGSHQAQILAKASRDWNIQAIFSSDLARAAETARIIAQELQIPLAFDADLREGNFGEAEGLTKDEILGKYGQDFVRRWKSLEERHLDLSFPAGESRRQILERFRRSIERILRETSWQIIAVVTHGSILKHFIQHVDRDFLVPTPIPNCGAFEVEFNPQNQQFIVARIIVADDPESCFSECGPTS